MSKSSQTPKLIPPTPPACPAWCEKPVGHPYDDIGRDSNGDIEAYRHHEAGHANGYWISQLEENSGNVVTLHPSKLSTPDGDPTTAEQVRKAAAEMHRLAHIFDQIQHTEGVRTSPDPEVYAGGWHVRDKYGEDDVYVIPRRFVEIELGQRQVRLGPDQARDLALKLLAEADTVEDITAVVYV